MELRGRITSTQQNPLHRYITSGVYTVRLDATDALGSCWNTNQITVSPLVASFIANQTSGLEPLTVQFTDKSTDQPISWRWNFGDGGTSTLQNPVHVYATAGSYLVNLNATNGYDGWMSAPQSQDHRLFPPAVLHGNPDNPGCRNFRSI